MENQQILKSFVVLLSVINLTLGYSCYRETDKASKSLELSEHSSSLSSSWTSGRFRRDATETATSSLQFDVGDYVRITQLDSKILSDEFTLSLWIYLEGGQPVGGTILGLKNTCFGYSPWSFKLQPASIDTNLKSKITFSIEDVYRQKKTVSIEEYKHNSWFHLAVVNSVEQLKMYVNGVRVATGEGMKWMEFTDTECVQIQVGQKTKGFRGKIKDLRISHEAISSRKIKQLHAKIPITSTTVWLEEPFSEVKSDWTTDSPPLPVQELISQKPAQTITAPTCGKTVCDNPAVVSAYSTNPELKRRKNVTMEILVMADTDGTNQLVPTEYIMEAKEFITDAFRLSNISWTFETKLITNTTLRKASIMLDCWPSMIGDGDCDRLCSRFLDPNFEDGKCYRRNYCYQSMINNNRCDSACNTADMNFDNGECCTEMTSDCIDPSSENRYFYHLSEVKDSIVTSENKLSLIVINWMDPINLFVGIASMPWERNSEDTIFGSVIVDTSTMNNPYSYDTVVHELGHALGLWHVHRGISEIACDDECAEKEASLVLGDLCSDTSPTAMHSNCEDPDVSLEEVCSVGQALENTPYTNVMSYSNGSCSDSKVFSPQQSARMHCYLDLVHDGAVQQRKPSSIPLPPQVSYADTDSVTLSWLPPFSTGRSSKVCDRCDSSKSLTQYADTALMGSEERLRISTKQKYAPNHATGAPDAAPCKLTTEVWAPIYYYYKLYIDEPCQLNFTFTHSVRPKALRLWVPWYYAGSVTSPVLNITLISPEDVAVKTISDIHIQCDKPFTKVLNLQSLVNKVIIHTNTPELAIDAIELTSLPQSDSCASCKSLTYKVEREPPFPASSNVQTVVSETLFEDDTVESDMRYLYQITAVLDEVEGHPSQKFPYVHNQEFCGNGILDNSEECDDSNIANGDGCSTHCKQEHGYVCIGAPSICWMDINLESKHCSFKFTHDEDGCGYHVPSGYTDQWASSVTASGNFLTCSSEHLLLGPPPPRMKCLSELPELSPPLWLPCQHTLQRGTGENYYLKFGFEKSVVVTTVTIHIGSDGGGQSGRSIITASQVYEGEEESQSIGTKDEVNCRRDVITFTVRQDLSKPFKYTKEIVLRINNRAISIAALRVRTFANFDPVKANTCSSSHLYNSGTNSCQRPTNLTSCEQLEVTNGNVSCIGLSGGSSCTVFCDLGYETSTVSGTTTCIGGKWQPAVTCDIVRCPRPVVPMGYAVCKDGHHFNSVCEISCSSPSELKGNGTVIKCLESGIWTEARASCLPVCPDLTTQNAALLDESCSGVQEVGAKCRMECNEGYYIRGRDEKTTISKPVCQASGEWDAECVRVQCEDKAAIWSGHYNCTDGVNSGSVCTSRCAATQTVSVVSCSLSGRWNDTFNGCGMSDVRCPSIIGSRPDIAINCTGTSIGTICRATCKNASLVLHQVKRTGSDVTTVTLFKDKLRCISPGVWSPVTTDLRCDSPCGGEHVGDGWCDAANNREVCQWDGGDCCQSTTKAERVQSFPETCLSECECKDPAADGNRPNVAARRYNVHSGYAVDYKH